MGECCEPQENAKAFCPKCRRQRKAVQDITLKSLLKDPDKMQDKAYLFCATPGCDSVYFSSKGGAIFYKKDLKVRVGLKEPEDPIPLCYCFGWDCKRI